ncbi:sugar phosphate isomerase/epimerase family protein [Streptomyces luteireticuli]|uniref:sugar phosphate isomerase/epimerase family protein n=1 Tax=Streptomyces luteireticuli TaxID=173858 RepID=UPI0035585E02
MRGQPALAGGMFTAGVDQATPGYRLPLDHLILAAGRAGFSVLEVPAHAVADYYARHGTSALKRLLDEQGVQVGQLSCGTGIPADLTAPSGAWPEAVRRWGTVCHLAERVGCGRLSVFVPRPATDARLVTGRLSQLARIATGHGLVVSVEVHAPALLGQAAQIVQEARNEGEVGLLVDVAALVLAGRDPLADLAAWPPGTVTWVHLADLPEPGPAAPRRVLPGHGRLPLADVLTALHHHGYTGVVSVEVPRTDSTRRAAAARLSWAAAALTRPGLAPFFTPKGDVL